MSKQTWKAAGHTRSRSGVASMARCEARAESRQAPCAGGNSGYMLRCPGRCAASRAMRSDGPAAPGGPAAGSRAASTQGPL